MKSQSINLQKLAKRLIATETASGRKSLLKNVSKADFLELAKAVKELCYSYWTSEPTKAQNSAGVLQIIYKLSPQKEIKAYLEWISGISEITRGKLSSAVKNLDKSALTFLSLGEDNEAAQTQVSKLYVLAFLGKYEEAIECGENALKVFENYGDELAAGKVEKNLGNVAARQGNESITEKYYLKARQRFLNVKNIEELTMAENSLANTYVELNNFRKAESFYSQALNSAKEAKMFVTEAEIEASMGNLALFRGQLDRALKYLEISRQKYENLKMPHQTAIAELEIADVYLELNLTEEALAIYKTVAEKLQNLKMRGEEARARASFGRVAVLRNDFSTARKQLKKAARLYVLEKNTVGAATVKIAQANLELSQTNYKKARQISEEVSRLLLASENLRLKLSARFSKAEALRNLNENEKAEKELLLVFADSIKNEQPNTAQAAQISLGKLAVGRRDFRRAESHFKQAIRLIETVRAPLAAEEFRMAFLANNLAPFEHLAAIYLAENKIKKAFLITERARSRSLTENLSENFTASKNPKASGNLSKKLENLREELNWFYSRLNRADESEIKNLQTETGKREKQIADVMRQIASTRSSRADFTGQTAANETENFKLLQKSLGERKALIEFVNSGGNLSAFVITDGKIQYFESLAKESEVLSLLESLQFQFGALRYGAKNLGKFVDELKKRADFYLRKLYEKLFAPLENFVGNRDLVIVPVGATNYVPFHALFDGAKYLIETREIVHAPGATVWQFLASKRQKKSDHALLIGYADERIPLVNREIETLKKIFPHAESFTGERANVAAFIKNAARFDILHLACHGQFRPESPLFSSLHLADGWLTVRDIAAQKLKAELVTLSACETGLNKIFAGEEILGLARGFLSAGAKSLLLSLWTVNDEATGDLMQKFYEQRQTGKSSAKSLQIAQKNFIERGVHPYFWSPFLLIGK
ncbi:MAG: CHAT domain-containing protein [Pyrinomonadaceae bacterium]|nr:CHAT domain-containing protein [Pyrinomonadaceae bacterium]